MGIMARKSTRVKVEGALRRNWIYRRWNGMIRRCYHKNSTGYSKYGARGVTVCQEWRDSFEAFQSWARGSNCTPDLTLDRREADGPYSPENCRWVSQTVQQRNRTNNRYGEAFGESKLICEWSEDERCVVGDATLRTRLHKGWELELAMTTPKRPGGRPKKV